MALVKFLEGKKTYIIAIVTFLYGLVYYGWGQDQWAEALSFVLGSGGIATLRGAIAKVEAVLKI